MKKNTISVEWNEEKEAALKLYLKQKNIKLEDKITETLDSLYVKYVPAAVRCYVDFRSAAPQKTPAKSSNITPKNDDNSPLTT